MNASKMSKVLIVEDQLISRRMLESMLSKNYTVISASCGTEAIELARKNNPDMVLLDIEMPDMDGFQTMAILRNGVIDEAVPVIFLTAREDSESRETGLQAGAVDYITKPYDRQELSIKVKNHLALYEARKEIERRNQLMAREMEMASQLQQSLLPTVFPKAENIHFSVYYKPVSKAGGDFYDFMDLQGGQIGSVVVDVAGHGVASAMIGAMFKMCFHSFARTEQSPAKLLANINEDMVGILPDSDFLTVFYFIVDPLTLQLTYCNAGHPKPLLYHYDTKSVEELGTGGPLLGAFGGMEYDNGKLVLNPGDRLLVYTDGITETRSPVEEDEFYGLERLQTSFLDYIETPPDDNLKHIIAELNRFRTDGRFDDDLSFVLLSIPLK